MFHGQVAVGNWAFADIVDMRQSSGGRQACCFDPYEAIAMPRFIQLEDAQGNTMEINPDHIEMMKATSGDPDCPAAIQIAGKGMKVRQPVDEIKERIRRSGQKQTL